MDEWMFDRINDFARSTPWLHGAAVGYATYGVVVFAMLLVAGWWIARREDSVRQMAGTGCAAAATLIAVAVNQPIVDAVHRARPYTTHPHLLVLAQRSGDFSFPSDHATMAGAVAAGLLLVSRRLGAVAAVAALLMAFSRVYIAAHYPLDVVCGLVLGAVIAVITYALAGRLLARIVVAVGRTNLHALVIADGSAAGRHELT